MFSHVSGGPISESTSPIVTYFENKLRVLVGSSTVDALVNNN